MRILLVQESDWLKKGPHDQHILAEKLSQRGHETRAIDFDILWKSDAGRGLFSKREVYADVSKIYSDGRVTVIRPGFIRTRIPGVAYASLLLSHWRELRRQIREFVPDVIVGLGILNTYTAVRLAKRSNIPFIHYWLDMLHMLIPVKPLRPVGKLLEKRIVRQADMVLTTNKRLRNRIIELGASPAKTQILTHGIDFDKFNLEAVDRDLVRR